MKTALKEFYRYLPLSDGERARPLYVMAGGYTFVPPDTPYPPGKHPADHNLAWERGRKLFEYQVIYITRGAGQFEMEPGVARRIEAGDVFVLFPGIWHRYRPDPGIGWDEYWVAFQGVQVPELMRESGISCEEPVLNAGVQEYILHEFRQISEELAGEKAGCQQVIAARVMQILANVSAAVRRKEFEGKDILRIIEKAKLLLGEQLDRSVNVEQMAASLNVGYSWFRRMFCNYVGVPPAQYQQQLRLNRACELLRNTKMPVADVAERSGFGSSYYLARVFKKRYGKPPTAFRG